MDIFERFNTKFGKWYEGLFGGDAGELRPKDVLRKITAAMEENRKEGFDNKVYVPNKYVLELAITNPEERDYLLSFLDEEELTSVLQRFMAQNQYHARGPLDFTIAEVPEAERAGREKLRVRPRWEKGENSPPAPAGTPVADNAGAGVAVPNPPLWGGTRDHREQRGGFLRETGDADDLPTVPAVNYDEEDQTVPAIAWAALAVTAPDGRKSHFSLTKPSVTIGRSRNAGNDLVLDSDGMASKSHARIERERDGRFTLYDLGSTNGVTLNGRRVEGNHVLSDGDEIVVGATKLTFQQAAEAAPPAARVSPGLGMPRRARLRAANGDEFVLASETLIGRAVTSDIVLTDPSVSTKHAQIVSPDAATYYLEDLGSEGGTRVNGRTLPPGQRTLLADGDVLQFGAAELRFTGGGTASP